MFCSVLSCPVRLESFVLSSKIHGGGYRHFSVKDSQNISITGHHNIRMKYKCGGKKKSGIKSPHFMVNVEDVIRIHSFSNIEIIIIYSFSLFFFHILSQVGGWWLMICKKEKKNCSTIHYSVQPSFFRELVIT